ncbi:MAG: flagellar biosynthesis protein FlgD [Pirellula sp.]|jgi:flagellar basal-body rod modification protein FlgD|nr:flagellar biosynthesis protein FlgD [Pirellula sp.]
MSRVSNAFNTSASQATSSAANSVQGDGLNDVDMSQFLTLMITELQNQDPLNPTDNAALLEQIGQLRSIGANDQLVNTLSSFSNTQELTTASSLIGKKVSGLDVKGDEVNGEVSSVSVKIDEKDRNKRTVQVHVGSQIVDMRNVRQINLDE